MSDTLNAADTPQTSADQPVADAPVPAPAPAPAPVLASVDVPDDGTKIAIGEPAAAKELAPTPSTDLTSTLETAAATGDVLMPDAPTGDNAPSPAPAPQPFTPTVASPMPRFTMPDKAASHGDPVRQYLNNNVTTVLLDGMKQIAKDKPKDPLRVLGNYLIQRSKELEQTDN
ncbi:Set1 complex component sdc1 like protein [Verticillium longisporum]|uniref:Set1 complex component sdc1 like protein n=1 Tax=Verticillium longisporum TaxID=100787 RepID=A0A8I2ZSD4_VERLO|nr:Set1 complex component sdc1 like protein [Verticillium longisporum]